MDGASRHGRRAVVGPVEPEPNEPVFHAEWERRAFALTLAMGMPGGWNIDMSRFAREDRAARRYILPRAITRYGSRGSEQLMLERGLVGAGRDRGRQAAASGQAGAHGCSTPDDVAAVLHRGGPTEREPHEPARYSSRRRSGAHQEHPSADPHPVAALCARPCRHHRARARLPRVSRQQRDRPAKIRNGSTPCLRRPRIVGRRRRSDGRRSRSMPGNPIWSRRDGRRRADRIRRDQRAIEPPGIPRDADGPVFREPWEAQAFAHGAGAACARAVHLDRMGGRAGGRNQARAGGRRSRHRRDLLPALARRRWRS